MIAFILRRFAQAIIVMLAVALVSFVMFRYMGDPITNLQGQEATVVRSQDGRKRRLCNDSINTKSVVSDFADCMVYNRLKQREGRHLRLCPRARTSTG